MVATRDRLIDGALRVLAEQGLTGASARAIANTAGVNQSLIFYHFGSVDELLTQACRRATEQRVALYRARFAAVTTFAQLLAIGRQLHATERAEGNVTVLAQLLAGAQTDPRLAPAVAEGLNLWFGEIEAVLHRLTVAMPMADLFDVPGLARAVASAFIGLELYEGVDTVGAARALDALEQLSVLVEVVDGLGPVARRALRAKIRRAGAS
ncbi:TetR family transcriptional regulator [Rugosimonospora acidiphila]|uniref:TetR family transcriptional regulator n=1 Tax=Rugosimonospora acidiphila TaxID=556531 RepID=A0ABP9RLL1_9ACTN